MNSKETLKKLYFDLISFTEREEDLKELRNDYLIVKQDLDKLKKLEKTIEILKDSLELTLYHNKILNIYSVELMCFEEHLGMEVTQEEYELLKEILEND